jgi:putative Mn2+ efflux pump MntP
MIGDLLFLGFTLSLDNFRTAIALGGLRLKWRNAGKVALAFGFWDAAAPLVGIGAGHYLDQRIGSTAEYVGAIALAAYGLYLLVQARRTEPLDGAITAVMSFVGLQLGRAAARFVFVRSDVLTGASLVVMATVLGLGLGG